MKLKGKFKEAFEKWYKDNYWLPSLSYYIDFYELTEAMQIGVYEDFADNVNIDISVKPVYVEKKKEFYAEVDTVYFFYAKTRYEAREWAVKQLEEIYNDKIQWL